MTPMKISTKSTFAFLTILTGTAILAVAAPKKSSPLVNEYGEPTGFGNLPDVIVADAPSSLAFNQSRPGLGGWYAFPGTSDPRSYESLGNWQARQAALNAGGTVTIGTLEVLDSGPTGPMAPDAIDAANAEVTAQVLNRIKTTDRTIAALRRQSKELDSGARAQFETAAAEVSTQRQALRESLKVVRASEGDQWTNARAAVAVNYNSYVQALHRAEAAARTTS